MEGNRTFFTIAVSLLPQRTQRMADSFRGRPGQSRTGGGTIYFTLPFQVPDTRTARGQHGPAARQSRVRIPATDSVRAETRNTSLKLCREADCTVRSAPSKHKDTDRRAAQTQHRRGAMLVGIDVIPPVVQHLHALTCQFKTSKLIDSIGLS